jgi:hypothetical protein
VTVGLLYALVKIWPHPTLSGESASPVKAPAADSGLQRVDSAARKTGVTRNADPTRFDVALAAVSLSFTQPPPGTAQGTAGNPQQKQPPDTRNVPMIRGYPGHLKCPDTAPRVWIPADSLHDPECVSLFTKEFPLWKEQRLFLIVIFAGALGAVLRALGSIVWYTGTRYLRRSWLLQYYMQPLRGAVLGILFYFLLRGGLFSSNAPLGDTSPAGFAAVAALVGLFEKEATRKLQMIAEALFTPHAQSVEKAPTDRQDKPPSTRAAGGSGGQPASSAPVITSVDPPIADAGTASLPVTITGSGFVAGAIVHLTRDVDPPLDVRRQPASVTDTAISVTLTAEDLAVAGPVKLAVVNPPPGGTSSPDVIRVA